MAEKLVRDKIPALIRADGQEPTVRVAHEEEMRSLLFAKLQEEARELEENPCAEELADVIEVLNTLREHIGVSEETLENTRQEKEKKKGSFKDGLVLEGVR